MSTARPKWPKAPVTRPRGRQVRPGSRLTSPDVGDRRAHGHAFRDQESSCIVHEPAGDIRGTSRVVRLDSLSPAGAICYQDANHPGGGHGLGETTVAPNDLSQSELRSLLEQDETEMSVVFSDPSLPDNPMIFVSDEFEAQTGYSVDEALGRNCRFLQGPDTNPHAVEAIRQGLKAETRFTIDILNYRKDGTPFMNRLRIRPIYDEDGRLMFFAGAQNPV